MNEYDDCGYETELSWGKERRYKPCGATRCCFCDDKSEHEKLQARIAELEAELNAINAQAGDATEYVLAQVNRELKNENRELKSKIAKFIYEETGEEVNDA